MQPSEAIDFFIKQSERAAKGLASAKLAENYQLSALNGRQLFKSKLMHGLILWRIGEDPRRVFGEAVDAVVEGATVLQTLDGNSDVGVDLPLERASILSYLIGRSFVLQATGSELSNPEKYLDNMLMSEIETGIRRDEFMAKIASVGEKKDFSLVARIYRSYADMLDKSEAPSEEAVTFAEKLFLNRSTDKFYSGGEQTEGGGADNKLVVDYRLGAVLKKLGYIGNSAHRWRW